MTAREEEPMTDSADRALDALRAQLDEPAPDTWGSRDPRKPAVRTVRRGEGC